MEDGVKEGWRLSSWIVCTSPRIRCWSVCSCSIEMGVNSTRYRIGNTWAILYTISANRTGYIVEIKVTRGTDVSEAFGIPALSEERCLYNAETSNIARTVSIPTWVSVSRFSVEGEGNGFRIGVAQNRSNRVTGKVNQSANRYIRRTSIGGSQRCVDRVIEVALLASTRNRTTEYLQTIDPLLRATPESSSVYEDIRSEFLIFLMAMLFKKINQWVEKDTMGSYLKEGSCSILVSITIRKRLSGGEIK